MTRLSVAFVVILAVPRVATAQNRHPASDAPITLSSGTVVRVRNLVVFRGSTANSLTIFVETPTPASDTARLAREARELADLHTEFANGSAISRVAVSICRTAGCLALRESPKETIHFVRAKDQAWTRDTVRRHE